MATITDPWLAWKLGKNQTPHQSQPQTQEQTQPSDPWLAWKLGQQQKTPSANPQPTHPSALQLAQEREAAAKKAYDDFVAAGATYDPSQNPIKGAAQFLSQKHQLEDAWKKAQDDTTAARDQETYTKNINILASMDDQTKGLISNYAAWYSNPLRNVYLPEYGIDNSAMQTMAMQSLQKLGQLGYTQDQVLALAETMNRQQNAQTMQQLQQTAAQLGEKHGVLGSVGSVAANLLGSFTGTAYALDETLKQDRSAYESLDPNLPGYIPSAVAGGIRQSVAQNIEGEEDASALRKVAGKAGSFLYQGTMGAADNLLRIAVGGQTGSLALAGLGSFQSAYQSAAARGGTSEQALLSGIASAGVEAITEKFSVDKLFNAKSPENVIQLLKNAASQGLVEVSEEELSFVGNLLFDAAIMGDKSEYNLRVAELSRSMSPEEAEKQALKELAVQAAETAAVSFVSGGFMSGGQGTVQLIGNRAANAQQTAQQSEPPQTAVSAPLTDADILSATVAKEPVGAASTAQEAISDALNAFLEKGAVSNNLAKRILTTPGAAAALQQAAGLSLSDDGQANSDAVKNAIAALAQNSQAAPDGIRSQLRENQGRLNALDAVADIHVPHEYAKMSKAEKISWIEKKLQSTGYQVNRKGFGIIDFAMKRIKQAFRYLKQGSAEDAAFEAIPYVLENGVEIYAHDDHKTRGYKTVTIAAPVVVNGQRGNMAVVVKQTDGNYYKVHRILTPDGSVFELSEENNKTEPTGSGGVTASGSLATTKGSAPLGESVMESSTGHRRSDPLVQTPDTSIADTSENVNTYATESVGAAPSGFDQYSQLQYQYGNQPDRATDARPLDVPKKDTNGRIVSETAGNVAASPSVPDSAADLVKQMILDGDLGHEVKTNKQSVDEALEYIRTKGETDAQSEIAEHANSGRISDRDITAAAILFIRNANSTEKGATDRATSLMAALAQMATQSGRQLQLYKLLRKLTPEGQLLSVKKSVQRAVDSYNKGKSAKKQVTPQIPQELDEAYLDAAQQAMEADAAAQEAQRAAKEAEKAAKAAQLREEAAKRRQQEAEARRKTAEEKQQTSQEAAEAAKKAAEEANAAAKEAEKAARKAERELKKAQEKQEEAEKRREEAERKQAEAEQAICTLTAAQLPATPMEQLNAWRRMAMLANVKTQLRNLGGNAAFRGFVNAKRTAGAALEAAFVPREQRTKSVLGIGREATALRKLAWEDAKLEAKKNAESEATEDEDRQIKKMRKKGLPKRLEYSAQAREAARTAIDDARKIFDFAPLEWARTKLMDAMEAEDMFFKRREYTESLASFVKARGYTSAQWQLDKIPQAVLEEGRSYAAQESLKATFNDLNALSAALSARYRGDKSVLKAAYAVYDAVLPFKRTPANVLARGLEYSPAGLAKALTYDIAALRSGKITASEYIDHLAAGLTGTGAMALGAALAKGIFGIRLTGVLDDEDEERAGRQAYSLEIGDKSYTVDWLAPSNLPLFVGANLYQNWQAAGENGDFLSWISWGADAVKGLLDPLLELSCLSALNDLVESVRYAEEGQTLYTIAASIATSYMTQYLPTVFSQVDQLGDENRQTIVTEAEDRTAREAQRIAGRISQRIPGIDLYQQDYVDAWGRTEKTNAFKSLVSPSYSSEINYTAADEEIIRLNAAQDTNVSPSLPKQILTVDGKEIRLSGEDYTKLKKIHGTTQAQIVSDLVLSDAYAALSDAQKVKAIKASYEYAREFARAQVLEDYSFSAKWMEGIDKDPAPVILGRVAEAAARDSGLSDSLAKEAVAGGASQDLLTYVGSLMKGLTPEEGYTNVRPVQQMEAIVDAPNLSDEDEEKWLRYLLDAKGEAKLDKAMDAGISADDYVAAYRIYLDNDSKKNATIAQWQQELGVSYETAEALYRIYRP